MKHNFFKNYCAKTYALIFLSGAFFFLDQILKYLARHFPHTEISLIASFIRWEFFENPGIAFSIYIPNAFVLWITPFVLVLLGFLFFHNRKRTPQRLFAISLIMGGAISNYIDRFLFSVTIDYLRIGSAVINLADVMIVIGALILMFSSANENKQGSESS